MKLGDSDGGFLRRARQSRFGRSRASAKWGVFSLLLAIVAGLLVVVVQPAQAGTGFGAIPTFPSPVTVGQMNIPASLVIQNISTTPDDVDPVMIQTILGGGPNEITLVPSCGSPFPSGPGDCPTPDPGVFVIDPGSAVGEAGTACAGTTFTVTIVNPATGKVAFTPSVPVVLQPPGDPLDTCRINFTFDVLKAPTVDSQPGLPGLQTSQIGYASGINIVTLNPGQGINSSSVTVLAATPTIVTSATPVVTIGSPISDTATVTGVALPAAQPTGTVTFTLFGPNDPTCAGPVIFNSGPIPLSGGPPPTANSGNFTPTAVGTYQWVAVYSGDANYNPVTSPCGAPNESSVVAAAVATIVTSATPAVTLGAPISDTATVTGAAAPAPLPTGTVTFTLFGPNDPTCAGPVIFNSGPIPLVPGAPPTATANSGPFTPTATGTYQWVAVYSGDANYNPVTSPCGAPNEASVVNPATPTIVTSATPAVTVGSPISDTATVTGVPAGPTPTGTVVFTLFGPGNPTCTGAPIFNSGPIPLVPGVPPTATANSGNFTPTATGTYNWVAVYSGDSNYTGATSPCGAPNEASIVDRAQATIATTATPTVTIGSPISDTAVVTGVPAAGTPTGTVIFTLFGPGNPTCTGAPIFTSAPIPLVPGPSPTATANSGNFTPTSVGTYMWVAVYSGDANYDTVTSPCGAPNESSVVNTAVATIVTNATPTAAFGAPISDTATVTGAVAPAPTPTGTVTFTLFGPNDPTCAGPPVFNSGPIPLVPGAPPTATANSGPFTPTAAGSYNWVAVYSGDAAYPGVTSPCGAPNETSVIAPPVATIVTSATPTVTITQPISDTATVSGPGGAAPTPTGTVVFTLFGPNNPTCTGAPIFTSAAIPLVPGVPPTATANSGPFTPTAVGTYNWVAVYSGDANYAPATSPCGAPNEASVVTALPTITVDKTATPLTRPEPGGDFTFNVVVTNTSNQVLTITSLTDDIYGDITTRPNSTCTTAIGTVLQPTPGPGNTYSCAFTAPFMGNDGDFQVDTVTVLATNPAGVVVTDTDDARVDLTDEPPQINIVKDVTPLTLPEPGGPFTYTITVTNPSTIEPVTITSLTDSVYGDLSTRGTCTTAIGTVLAINGGSYSCSFTAPFTGNGGDTLPDTATVIGVDDDGTTVTDSDDAVVTLTDVLPIISVDKTATPASLPENGGQFTFNVVVTNLSSEPVTITTLTDDVYGNIANQGTCTTAVGTVLTASPGPGNTYSCSFTGNFNGNAGATQTDTVTATAEDDDGNEATDTDDAIVTLTDVLPIIAVDKTATPASLPEPGGQFTFNVLVTNLSGEPLTITELTDDIYGNIANQGTCTTAVGTVLTPTPGPGNTYSCSFTGNFTGNAGASQTDTVTVVGEDDDGNEATDTDDAVVTITNLLPAILVEKSASPNSLPEPGGQFTFNVVVSNTGPEALTITTLTDDIYGNIATQGTCTTAVGTVLQPGGSYSCSFPGNFTGTGGASQTDVVTVTGEDDEGNEVSDTDDAVVTITDVLPSILVEKSAAPSSRPEPGGQFTFTVVVSNNGPVPVTIRTLTDDIYGNIATQGTCTTAVGTVLQPGGSYSCSFPGNFTGSGGASQTDVVTVTAEDADGNDVSDTDDATVTITGGPPVVQVVKTATPLSRPEPGGQFTFNVVVTNTSATEAITITALTDDIYGNIATQGTCTTAVGTVLQPGASYSCSFTGNFTGQAGATQRDVVTVRAVDDDGQQATDDDDAIVTITDVPPVITVVKTATPLVRNEPGGTFTFDVLITNTGTETVTIDTLTDDVYGNLNGRGTCRTGAVLQPGGTYRCSFNGDFIGNAGASQTDIVTTSGVDNDGTRVTARDDAIVRLVDVPPTVTVIKDADPVSRPEPGGSFTFFVTITNTSFEPVTVVAITDNIYGNLNGRGTCAVGTLLQPGASYKCQFTVDYRGAAGASQVDTVTATVVDNDGTRASATDDAKISLTPVGTPPVSPPLARTGGDVGGPARLAFALLLAGFLMLGITMRSRGRLVLAPSGGMAWFTGSPAGTALRGFAEGMGIGGGQSRPAHPSDDPDPRLGFHDVDPDDSGPYDAGRDDAGRTDDGPNDDGPDDDGPPSGGPTAGGSPPPGRGPSWGGSGAATPVADPPTVYEWEAAVARSTPTVGEPIPDAPEAPAAPQDQPFDVSLLPPPVFPRPPKKGNRITRLI